MFIKVTDWCSYKANNYKQLNIHRIQPASAKNTNRVNNGRASHGMSYAASLMGKLLM